MTYDPVNCGKCGQPIATDDETASRRRFYSMHQQCPMPTSEDEGDA